MTPGDDAWLDDQCRSLIRFGYHVQHPLGGAAWLSDDGSPDLSYPVHTWITGRMAHVYALGHLLGDGRAAAIADSMLNALATRLRDHVNGGWFSNVSDDASSPDEKSCYQHAFVVLAASSCAIADRPGARELLTEALTEWNIHFYEEPEGMYGDLWNGNFTSLDSYRGVNANMHAVEALLAAYDATGEREWLRRAVHICDRVANEFAAPNDWRIPEHFDSHWNPLPDFNSDHVDDQFKPYGATPGHGLEWSRLILNTEAALGVDAPDWMLPAAEALFAQAVNDGWAPDGADGFVYTTDWNGEPVVRDRMHWVVAEGAAAAASLYKRTGSVLYAELGRTWWSYINDFIVDHELGSWHHQLDATNRPIGTVWPGKPDLYHAVQATLIPRMPLAPGLAAVLARS